MKLIIAIVSSNDEDRVSLGLTKGGFSATKLATTGGFLKMGNTTFLVGVEDESVDAVMEVLRACSSRREQMVPVATVGSDVPSVPVSVSVGGATVFITDVEHFEKL
jgi:uncharacterized protein YaaQ